MAYNTLIVLIGTSLLGALAGALGTYMVLRRRALVGDALAHAALPGLATAFLITGRRELPVLLGGAFLTALLGSWLISAIRRHTRIKEDAAIGIVLSVLFGLGIAISGIVQRTTTGGNKAGLDSFIFGKTAGMVVSDVYFIIGISAVVLVALLLLHKEFKLLSFDGGFARVQGLPVLRLDLALMALVCVTTIIGLPAVGLVLMAALLIIPPAAARFWTERLSTMMILAAVLGLITGLVGTFVSAHYVGLPTGPIIILTGAAVFILSMLFSPRRGLVARTVRRALFNRRIEEQNLLRTLYETGEARLRENGNSHSKSPMAIPIAIEDLLERRAWGHGQARRLLARAERRGWVAKVGSACHLTADGWREAAQIVRAHRLWEIFLIEEAQAAAAVVDRDAEQIEHVLEPAIIDRLEERLSELGLLPSPEMPASPHALAHPTPRGGAA